MRIIGCVLHARQQTIAMLDTETGETVETTIVHEGEKVGVLCRTTRPSPVAGQIDYEEFCRRGQMRQKSGCPCGNAWPINGPGLQ
jgi:hypothetical protein